MSSPFKRLQPLLSYEKTNVELQPLLSYEKTNAELKASMRLDVEKWMASFKKTPTPKNSTEELEAKGKML
jgi:hypothetical protein